MMREKQGKSEEIIEFADETGYVKSSESVFSYKLSGENNGTVYVTAYSGNEKNVVIPSSLGGYTVKEVE